MKRLSTEEKRELESLAQYLNLEEMRSFCKEHGLPLMIHVEKPDGKFKKTGDRDRKDIVVRRILDFAVTGERTGPTIYGKEVIAKGPLPSELSSRTRLRYNQYEKHNPIFLKKMADLTEGAFRTGMIARLVLRDFWTAGEAPTLKQFANAWLAATDAHKAPRPEGAYLVDLAKGTAGKNWKKVRIKKARQAILGLRALIKKHR